MGRNHNLLTHAKAAEVLGVTRKWLTALVREGRLRPAIRRKKVVNNLYDAKDVHALLELRGKAVDMPSVAQLARQSAALSNAVADRLTMVCRLLGLDGIQLVYEQESMYQLHEKVCDLLRDGVKQITTDLVLEWAAIFNAIDEAYLRLLEDFTDYSSPWDIYLLLANRLAEAAKNTDDDVNLPFAVHCLDAARRSLRHVAYFYVAGRRGVRLADKLFLDDTATDEIISQLYPRKFSLQIPNERRDKKDSGGPP